MEVWGVAASLLFKTGFSALHLCEVSVDLSLLRFPP